VSDVFHADCPAREVLGHLTGRWTVLVLTALLAGPQRYHELRRGIEGVSDKMLSATLRTLVVDGLVARTVTRGSPPQVSYALTDLGRGASGALEILIGWVRDNADRILLAQAKHRTEPGQVQVTRSARL
jgi:DNA-binding HxlR family transcriptional regulator